FWPSTSLFFWLDAVSPVCVLCSFPTRRSSDLGLLELFARGRVLALVKVNRGQVVPGGGLAGAVAALLADLQGLLELFARGRVQPDRKSTRLNSSHGSISYAVFCLKKKKSDRKR